MNLATFLFLACLLGETFLRINTSNEREYKTVGNHTAEKQPQKSASGLRQFKLKSDLQKVVGFFSFVL